MLRNNFLQQGSGRKGDYQEIQLAEEPQCPLFDRSVSCCRVASVTTCSSDKRVQFCMTDEHDRCSTYLGYILRRTRPLRSDCDWLDAI